MYKIRFVFCLLFLFFYLSSLATDEDSVRVKKVKIYPFPAVGYAPETRWYFGGVVLLNMRFNDDTLLQTSTFETEINYTQNKQLIVTANFDLQFFKNKLRWMGDNGYYKFPEDYWGIGNETQESDKVSYDAKRLELDNSLLIKTKNKFYLGVRQRYHQMELLETIPDYYLPEEGERIRASGIGPRFLLDTRNNILNAYRGVYLSINYQWYLPGLGGDGKFNKFEFDTRFYQTIHKKGVLAVQAVLSVAKGDVPFRMYPLLGGENIMRGYYQGRYRDEGFAAVQGEYRFTAWRWLGGAVFGGGGKVAGPSDKGDFVLHPTYGAGLRIRIDKKENVNLRFDYARGDHSDGFYVAFGEAF